jgi:hypothetical protein
MVFMVKTKSKQLTLSHVKEKAKQAQKQEVYTLHDGAEIKFHPIFPETKIEELLKDLQNLFIEAKEKDVELTESGIFGLIHILTIKHMTNLKNFFKDGIEKYTLIANTLKDAGYFYEIINEVFDQKELHKIYDRVGTISGQNLAIEKMFNKAIETAKQIELQNEDIFKQLAAKRKQKQLQ